MDRIAGAKRHIAFGDGQHVFDQCARKTDAPVVALHRTCTGQDCNAAGGRIGQFRGAAGVACGAPAGTGRARGRVLGRVGHIGHGCLVYAKGSGEVRYRTKGRPRAARPRRAPIVRKIIQM